MVGVTKVRVVGESTVTEVQGTPPMETPIPCLKLVPVRVTSVPPSLGPAVGTTDFITTGKLLNSE